MRADTFETNTAKQDLISFGAPRNAQNGFWSVETVRPILGSFLTTELPEVVRLRLDLLGKRREM
jgi:hypothetical protein